MASCRDDQKRALTEHFTQQAVIKFCAKVARCPQKHGNVLVIIIVGMRVLGRLFLTGTSDFRKVVWTSATISGVGDPVFPAVLRTFKSQLRGTQFQNREVLKFAVGSAVAKFDADLNKDVYSKLVERHMKCAVCGGSYFEKECKT